MTGEVDDYGEMVRPKVGKGGPCQIREESLLRRETSGEEGWPWEGSRVGRSRFSTASCELLIAPSRASPLPASLSFPVLENQEGWWAQHHLVFRSTRRASKSGAWFRGQRGRMGDANVDKGQCGSPKVGLDCQNFRRNIVWWENATVRHPIGDGVVDECDKSRSATRVWRSRLTVATP